MIFSYKFQSRCLYEHASDVVRSTTVSEVSRQQLSCNRLMHQHSVNSELENILTTDSVDDGLDVDLIWCGLLEVETLQRVTISLGHCERDSFSTPPNNV
jgi:hypothetical protein